MSTADWYVPSVTSAQTVLPEGLFITMFDAKNHVDNGLTSEQIKQEYEQNSKAVGEYILSLSPERLALHETIVAMSLNLKFQSEDDFVAKFDKIYTETVLPKIKDKKHYFETMNELRRKNIEKSAKIYFSGGADTLTDKQHKADFDHYNQLFTKNLEIYKQRLAEMREQSKKERPTRKEREEILELQKTVDFMTENKERIIVDLVANTVTLRENKRLVEEIVSGKGGVFSSSYMDQFDKLTQHDQETRQAFLIVGGAASGKGGATAAVKKEQADPCDILEINPDLYKKLLLPYEEIGPYIEYHAAITHAESSIVFDTIAERWQNMARAGYAPNILMDVVRAGKWQLDVLSTGNTQISVSTPMLPVEIALERSYQRGQKTGRYVPTKELITGHKEQVQSNKNAMKRSIRYRFYDTNVPFGEAAPLITEYNPQNDLMIVTDMHVMWDYFSKGELNPEARSLDDLSFSTPQKTVKEILDHIGFMNLAIKDEDGYIAGIGTKDDRIVCQINDYERLKQNMGEKEVIDFLVGLHQNNVPIKADVNVKDIIEEALKSNQSEKSVGITENVDMACEQYAELLQRLLTDGMRVGKTEEVFIYDFANDPELKDKRLTILTTNLDVISNVASTPSSNEYDPEKESKRQKVLFIDSKVYNTPEKREALLKRMRMMLITTGQFEAEGIYMNERRKIADDYLFENTGKAEIQSAMPNPEAVRVAYKMDQAVKIPVQWGEYAIEKDGSLVIRERDIPELKKALESYQKDKDASHLLLPDGKSVFDVYGTDPFFVEDNYSYVYSDVSFRENVTKLLEQGVEVTAKNATKNYEKLIAYQVQENDKIVLSDSTLVKAGDWLCIPSDKLDSVQKQLDNNEQITDVFIIKKVTMEKSYMLEHDNIAAKPSARRNTLDK